MQSLRCTTAGKRSAACDLDRVRHHLAKHPDTTRWFLVSIIHPLLNVHPSTNAILPHLHHDGSMGHYTVMAAG
jgi:hypothetical protein